MATSAHKPPRTETSIEALPEELLLKIFSELAKLGPALPSEEGDITNRFPFRTYDSALEPHPGLRSYPFLSQVCRRWHNVLSQSGARQVLWREVVVDFGHELITAVHTPIAWSDQRPSDDEFRQSFAATRLSASRILRFVEERRCCIQRVVLKNSEGYYSDEGEFVNLQQKHNFCLAHFGMLLGMLRPALTELQVHHCADFFPPVALSAIACLPALRVLRLEEMRCRIDQTSLSELSNLPSLEELSVTSEDSDQAWLMGIDSVPKAWAALTLLRKLELRGHRLLVTLPVFLSDLPLTHLDVSCCKSLDLSCLASLTGLRVLALQGLQLVEMPMGLVDAMQDSRKGLPRSVFSLTSLTALNLSDNAFSRVPPQLSKLTRLQFLDLSSNARLQVTSPLNMLQRLKDLRLVDMRGIHSERDLNYWSEAKCASMRHLSAFSKALKRRARPGKVLLDLD